MNPRKSNSVRLFHRLGFHGKNWHVILMDGNYWTECSVCKILRGIPPGDLAEMPPNYPVEVREGLADRIARQSGR